MVAWVKRAIQNLRPGDMLKIGPGRYSVSHKFEIDLRGAATAQLQQSGLVAEKISCCPDDTFARAELYWSYRRDRGIHGRQLAYLLRAL